MMRVTVYLHESRVLPENNDIIKRNFGEIFLSVGFDPVQSRFHWSVRHCPVGVALQVPDLHADHIVLQIQLLRRLHV